MKTVQHFEQTLKWIDQYSISGAGIAISSRSARPYPEVSGYFIPSLLAWNETDRALLYGRWLLTQQHPEGCWGDPNLNQPYAFDTGQIVKGLLALAKATRSSEWDVSLRRACEWLVSQIGETGEPTAPDGLAWGKEVPLGVLLYSFEAVKRAGEFLNEPCWIVQIDKSIQWFLGQKELTNFTHLSHFHAYILEALCDLGFHDRARQGMEVVGRLQKSNGSVPGFVNVGWVCSTGLFQYAIVWYKLGENKRGDAAFKYAMKLQNRSGGWNGSYGWFKKYFPKAEISWAVKYFLDALQWKLRTSFENMAPIFSEKIEQKDGRYMLVRDEILATKAVTILDAGCGKGRYLRNLLIDSDGVKLHGADLSVDVMRTIPEQIEVSQGSLLQLPYPDEKFDFVYTVEALEHAVHIDGALRELTRVLRPGGKLLIIDKNINRLGSLVLPDWEQWFDLNELLLKLEALGYVVTVRENVPYEGIADGLFTAWIAVKKGQVA